MPTPRINPDFFNNDIDVDYLVWVDVETSGLIAHDGTLLLEVAALVTDLNLNILDEHGYESVVLWSPQRVAQARATAGEYVMAMHDRTGLWTRASDPEHAKPVTQVDDELYKYISGFAPDVRTARLAGSSVRLDLNFADEFLPKTAAHLHYRMYDVSSIDLFVKRHVHVTDNTKVSAHTAMSDIRESIAQARNLDAAIAGLRG